MLPSKERFSGDYSWAARKRPVRYRFRQKVRFERLLKTTHDAYRVLTKRRSEGGVTTRRLDADGSVHKSTSRNRHPVEVSIHTSGLRNHGVIGLELASLYEPRQSPPTLPFFVGSRRKKMSSPHRGPPLLPVRMNAVANAASPPFISAAPRPHISSPTISAAKGGWLHSFSSTGTVSRWPVNSRVGPGVTAVRVAIKLGLSTLPAQIRRTTRSSLERRSSIMLTTPSSAPGPLTDGHRISLVAMSITKESVSDDNRSSPSRFHRAMNAQRHCSRYEKQTSPRRAQNTNTLLAPISSCS